MRLNQLQIIGGMRINLFVHHLLGEVVRPSLHSYTSALATALIRAGSKVSGCCFLSASFFV